MTEKGRENEKPNLPHENLCAIISLGTENQSYTCLSHFIHVHTSSSSLSDILVPARSVASSSLRYHPLELRVAELAQDIYLTRPFDRAVNCVILKCLRDDYSEALHGQTWLKRIVR